MSSNYNININDYTEQELLQILKISVPIELLTVSQLKTHLNSSLSILSASSESSASSSYNNIIHFFKQAASKIERSIKTNQPVVSANSSPPIKQSTGASSSFTPNLNANATNIDSITPRTTIIPNYSSVINTTKTQYPEGVINPIQKKTITKIINIDSIFRSNYDNTMSTNFKWHLTQRETNVVSMRVSSVDVPVQWYSITDKMRRNEFQIKLYNMNDLSDIEHTIKVPAGNYMSDTFTNMLNIIFKKQGGGLEYITADVDSVTAKTVIRAVDKDDILADTADIMTHAAFDASNSFYAPDFRFAIDFFPQKNNFNSNSADIKDARLYEFQRTIGWYMGFRKYTYEIKKSNIVQQILYDPYHLSFSYDCGIESESSYSSSRDNYIFLCIDDYNSNCVCQSIVSSTKDSYIGNNILARLTVDTIHNTVLFDSKTDLIFKERVYMGPVTIEKMNISLINRYGEPIDLNLNNFSLTLELTKLY
jgi:hypothetical protein